MKKVFITTVTLLLALCPAESEGLEVTGLVGGQVEIKCSHKFAKHNKKYFCKDTCTGSDILVHTEDSKDYTKTGRYSIDDRGDGDLTVTINNLKMSDSGTYWCGVDRFFIDTSQEVLLRVLDASPTQPDITRTSPRLPVIVSRTTVVITTEKAVSGESLTIATPTEAMTTDSATESANSKRTAFQPIYSTPTNQNIVTACDITTSTNPCPDDIYSNIGSSTEAPDTVNYATVNFPRDPACLHYATVNFPRDPACLHYATVNFP
ncbi:uncharacterized protein ACWYII_004070 isoform 2-T2 [Salvelinus alpinus]